MIDTGWKRTTGSPYWETAGHDRGGMPETAHPLSVSYLSSFLFRKTGIYVAQAHVRALKTQRMMDNLRSQNGSFHAVFGTFGSRNRTPGWPKTEGHHGHQTRLSGSYFRYVGTFFKSGADNRIRAESGRNNRRGSN